VTVYLLHKRVNTVQHYLVNIESRHERGDLYAIRLTVLTLNSMSCAS